jgi:hypothetical protein
VGYGLTDRLRSGGLAGNVLVGQSYIVQNQEEPDRNGGTLQGAVQSHLSEMRYSLDPAMVIGYAGLGLRDDGRPRKPGGVCVDPCCLVPSAEGCIGTPYLGSAVLPSSRYSREIILAVVGSAELGPHSPPGPGAVTEKPAC